MYVCLYSMYTRIDAYTLCVHVVRCLLWLLGRKPGFFFFFQLGCESYPVGSICSSDSTLQKNKARSLPQPVSKGVHDKYLALDKQAITK